MTKVAWGAEAAELTDLCDGLIGFQQHPSGCANPEVQQVGNSRGLKVPLEASGTLPLADGCGVSDLLQGKSLGEVLVNEAEHLLDPGDIAVVVAGNRPLPVRSEGQKSAPELAEMVLQLEFITERLLPSQVYHIL